MSLQSKRWQIASPVSAGQLERLADLPPLLVQLLHNRGLGGQEVAQEFLEGRFAGHNPFQLKGMERAVTRLRRAIRHGEPIVVYGDFDADGVTATVLLVKTLADAGRAG